MKKKLSTSLLILIFSFLFIISIIGYAAPSSKITPINPNFITIGTRQTEKINFTNSASSDINDLSSTIQYITLAAANKNPLVASIKLDAKWEIFTPIPDSLAVLRASGNVTGFVGDSDGDDDNRIYTPYSNTIYVDIYTWNLGPPGGSNNLINYTNSNQFENDLKILRPNEYIILTITIECLGEGDSAIEFFFRASEYEPPFVPLTAIGNLTYDPLYPSDPDKTERMNIYYQNTTIPVRGKGWWPLHNSFDPYDANIDPTSHVFLQSSPSSVLKSWTISPTKTAFSKANKMVHQEIATPFPCINIVKGGPITTVAGSQINYSYVVTNCGNVPLSEVSVEDDLVTPVTYQSGDLNNDGILNLTETWIFTATYQVPVGQSEPIINNATATGKYEGDTVEDKDNHNCTIAENAEPCIHLEKDGPETGQLGQIITYVYTVTNCGNVELKNISIVDQDLGIVLINPDSGDDGDGILSLPEIWIFTTTYTLQGSDSPQKNNTATAYGYTDEGIKVNSTDSHLVDIVVPPEEVFSFHICGYKFIDLNKNGIREEIEPKIDGVNITLLGADMITPADEYYQSDFTLGGSTNPEVTGADGLIGHYCFNLDQVDPAGGDYGNGTYIFYIMEDVPDGMYPTTPKIRGPITLIAKEGGPDRSPGNIFGNAQISTIGGTILPLNLVQFWVPWIILILIFTSSLIVLAMNKRLVYKLHLQRYFYKLKMIMDCSTGNLGNR